jgi:hypothetical protein
MCRQRTDFLPSTIVFDLNISARIGNRAPELSDDLSPYDAQLCPTLRPWRPASPTLSGHYYVIAKLTASYIYMDSLYSGYACVDEPPRMAATQSILAL